MARRHTHTIAHVDAHGRVSPIAVCYRDDLAERETIPCRCVTCGAIVPEALEGVPEGERSLAYPDTCCAACMARIRAEHAADYAAHPGLPDDAPL